MVLEALSGDKSPASPMAMSGLASTGLGLRCTGLVTRFGGSKSDSESSDSETMLKSSSRRILKHKMASRYVDYK